MSLIATVLKYIQTVGKNFTNTNFKYYVHWNKHRETWYKYMPIKLYLSWSIFDDRGVWKNDVSVGIIQYASHYI